MHICTLYVAVNKGGDIFFGVVMGFAKNDAEIAERLSEYLKTRIAEADLTYAELAERMKKHGRTKETASTIKFKLLRGTFSATFFVAAAAALGLNRIELKDI